MNKLPKVHIIGEAGYQLKTVAISLASQTVTIL